MEHKKEYTGFSVKADIVPLLKGLVSGLIPFANGQGIELEFQSMEDTIMASYNPEKILSEITQLISRIVTFTPQNETVRVVLLYCEGNLAKCILKVFNSGVDLSKIGEIRTSTSNEPDVIPLDSGTIFVLQIPISLEAKNYPKQKANSVSGRSPMYFAEVSRKLAAHFTTLKKLELLAEAKNDTQGIFFKKLHSVIRSRISEPDFKVDELAKAMALSRSQLYRKIKELSNMSPQSYLRLVRLEKAKSILQTNDPDLRVSEIGYQVGFSSLSHFTKSFRKQFGFNPSSFVQKSMGHTNNDLQRKGKRVEGIEYSFD